MLRRVIPLFSKRPQLFTCIATFLSALFLGLSFPNANVSYFAWIGLVPVLFLLKEAKTYQNAFWISYLTGALFFIIVLYWLMHVTVPGTIVFALCLAVYFGIFGLMAHYVLLRYKEGRLQEFGILWVIPSLWVVIEWIRAHALTGFGWGALGYSQAFNLPIVQIADIFGIYGVSFFIVFFNMALFLLIDALWHKRDIPHLVIITTLVVTFLSFGYGVFRLNNIFTGHSVRIGIVQGNIPQHEKWDVKNRQRILEKYENLTRTLSDQGAHLIVWPETSVPGYLETEKDIMDRLSALAAGSKANLFVGAPREDGTARDAYYNSALLFSEDGGNVLGYYDKVHLVPFGEYVPLKKIFSFIENFAPSPIGDFTPGNRQTVFSFIVKKYPDPGDLHKKVLYKVPFSCLICFEDLFPELSRKSVKNGARFLVNITNDAWFGASSAPYQHLQCSILRAVENRVNVVRSANTGVSCIIDQKGRIVNIVSRDGISIFIDGAIKGDIVLSNTRTIYNIYGDLPIMAAAFIIIAIFLYGSNKIKS